MHWLRSTIIFPKMVHLKCQLENLAEIYIILLFTHLYALLHYKSILIPNLRYMLTQSFHINHKKCRFGRHPALGTRCYTKWLTKIVQDKSNLNCGSHFTFSIHIVSYRLKKNTLEILVKKILLKITFWFDLFCFKCQIFICGRRQTAHCTLYQCPIPPTKPDWEFNITQCSQVGLVWGHSGFGSNLDQLSSKH